MRLLGCATSRSTGHLGPPVMHGTGSAMLGGGGAFGGWRGSGGRGGRGSGGSRDRGGLCALAGCPVGVECLPGLKSATADLRSGHFNVFARLEARVSLMITVRAAGWDSD
jgi:hypothetical protein